MRDTPSILGSLLCRVAEGNPEVPSDSVQPVCCTSNVCTTLVRAGRPKPDRSVCKSVNHCTLRIR